MLDCLKKKNRVTFKVSFIVFHDWMKNTIMHGNCKGSLSLMGFSKMDRFLQLDHNLCCLAKISNVVFQSPLFKPTSNWSELFLSSSGLSSLFLSSRRVLSIKYKNRIVWISYILINYLILTLEVILNFHWVSTILIKTLQEKPLIIIVNGFDLLTVYFSGPILALCIMYSKEPS